MNLGRRIYIYIYKIGQSKDFRLPCLGISEIETVILKSFADVGHIISFYVHIEGKHSENLLHVFIFRFFFLLRLFLF